MTDIDRLPLSSWGAPDIADEIADKDVIVVKGGSVYTRLERQPAALVQAEVAAEARKLLAGVSKDTFSIGSRAKVELRDVELIVKDLVRKQELLRRLGWARSGEVISASAAD